MSTTTLNAAIYTPELAKLIYADAVQTRFRYELLDRTNTTKTFLDCVQNGGYVANNYLAEIKGTCGFEIAETGNFSEINFITDRVKPYFDIYDIENDNWMSYPLGVYVLSSGTRIASKKIVTRSVDGYDLTQVLKRSKHLTRYVLPVGTVITDAIKALLTTQGLVYSIPDSDEVLTAERSYDPGGELILTINDLLGMINYRSLFFDSNGIANSMIYIPPGERSKDFDYITDSRSIVVEGATLSADIFDVPNVVQVVVSQPDKPVISAIATNNNPDSPTSVISTGDTRVQVYSENEDVNTQALADAKAKQYLSEISQIFETIEFDTAPVPTHGENSILSITHTDLGVSANYSETSWRLTLKSGSTMSHSARRTVSV